MEIKVKFPDDRDGLVEGHIEMLLERVMAHAEMTSEKYKSDKKDLYYN